jgi:hypothetical protein
MADDNSEQAEAGGAEPSDAEATLLHRVEHIERVLETIVGELGQLKGRTLEARVRTSVPHYLRGLISQARVVELDDVLAQLDLGAVEPADMEALERLDLVAEGSSRSGGQDEVYLAVEISWRVDAHDVRRADERARILAAGTGKTCHPAVIAEDEPGGHLLTLARELGVAVVDGDGIVREGGRARPASTDA